MLPYSDITPKVVNCSITIERNIIENPISNFTLSFTTREVLEFSFDIIPQLNLNELAEIYIYAGIYIKFGNTTRSKSATIPLDGPNI